MKRAEIVLLLGFMLLSVLLVEGSYRLYLARRLGAEVSAAVKPDAAPTFGFYSYPAPWRFDVEQCFVFNETPWLVGDTVKGMFNSCGAGIGNKFGNAYRLRSDYDSAAVKILLLGSSYTMVPTDITVPTKERETVTDMLEARLSVSLGKPVSVLNFSRDSTGLLTHFDIARAKIPELKPHLLLFVFNTVALGYQRHWRVVHPDPHDAGTWRMAFSLDPTEGLDNHRRVVLQPAVISNEVTQEWCDRMITAMKARDHETLRNDRVIRKLGAAHRRLRQDLDAPLIAVDFYTPRVSFVYKQLAHGNPYYDLRIYEDKTIWAPLTIDDFSSDGRFVNAVEFVKRAGAPFLMIHIPALDEMVAGRNGTFNFGGFGVPAERERSLAKSLERLSGRPIIHLYEYYDQEAKRDPLSLVYSPQNSHPNPKGVAAMAEAMERLLVETELTPSTMAGR